MLEETLGLRDTLPEHGIFLDVHLPRACPATSAGKTNHWEGILGSQPGPLTSERAHSCLSERDSSPPLIKTAMVLPQPTLCPPKTCHPAFLHRQLALKHPRVLLTDFAAALGFLAQAAQETWSMLLTLNRRGDGLLGASWVLTALEKKKLGSLACKRQKEATSPCLGAAGDWTQL